MDSFEVDTQLRVTGSLVDAVEVVHDEASVLCIPGAGGFRKGTSRLCPSRPFHTAVSFGACCPAVEPHPQIIIPPLEYHCNTLGDIICGGTHVSLHILEAPAIRRRLALWHTLLTYTKLLLDLHLILRRPVPPRRNLPVGIINKVVVTPAMAVNVRKPDPRLLVLALLNDVSVGEAERRVSLSVSVTDG